GQSTRQRGGTIMLRWRAASGLLVLGLWLGLAAGARGERVPSSKTVLPPSPGARPDHFVPYLGYGPATGDLSVRALDRTLAEGVPPLTRTTLGVWHGVAPS